MSQAVAALEHSAQIDREAVRRFLDLMAEGEPVTFQTFADNGKRKAVDLAQHFTADLADACPRLERLNEAGAGVFWMVNYGDGKGRSKGNVTGVRAVFVDLDGSPLAPVLTCGLDPHAIVESSPGRWHAYWLVQGATLEQFGPLQRALAAKFGGDSSVTDLPRVMRLPGFWHCKHEPFQSRLIELHHVQPYEVQELISRLQLKLEPQRRPVPTALADSGIHVVPEGGRHKHLESLFGTLNRKGATLKTIMAALVAENQSRCQPPLADADVQRLAIDMLKRYGAQHGEAAVAPARGRDERPEPPDEQPGARSKAGRSFDAADLLAMPMAEPNFIVRPFVPEGVTLWCGRPKLGKTTALRQLAHSVNTRGTFLGEQCGDAEVWFLSLEEGERLFRKKLASMQLPVEEFRGIRLEFEWPRGADGVALLRQRLRQRMGDRPLLIIIDSLSKFREPQTNKEPLFTQDYNAGMLLADLCKEFAGLSLVVLHHTVKAVVDDPVLAISGSNGVSAAADSYAIMLKQGGQYRLHAGGRLWDRDESDFELSRSNGRWELVGEWDRSPATAGIAPKQQKVLDALRSGAKSNRDLAELTGQSASGLSHLLGKLEDRGMVVRIANGWGLA